MPVTRSRKQAKIDFPAKKTVRLERPKSLKVQNKSQTPQKRVIKQDILRFEDESPIKRKKDTGADYDENSGPLLTPTKMFSPKREPLTPRKENIMSPNPRYNQTTLRTPGKENVVQSSLIDCQEMSPTPSVRGITKARFLRFDSPVKNSVLPRCVATPRPHTPVISPLRLARQDGICYQRAKQALNTAIPQKLLCRETEFGEVNSFLECHLHKSASGSLYISGAPGTGKTAVMTQIMQQLKADKHQLIYINCMTLRNSQAIYNTILSQLRPDKVNLSVKQAQAKLEHILTAKGNMVVLVLDEMDQLDSKNQEILYTMFEWPSLKDSRLVLIGIANALDLTDRILPRLLARPDCRPQLLHFPPYSREQIIKVLQDRLSKVEVDGQNVLEMSALKFCASKVAAITGDMRKALDVCRRAVELVESDVRRQQILNMSLCRSPTKRPATIRKIGVPHILKIINEVYGSSAVFQAGKPQTVPLQQKLVICTLLLLIKSGKSKEVAAGKLHETYSKVCRKQNVTSVDQSEFLSMCSLIEARGIMRIKKSKDARSSKISLKLDESELEAALQDKTLISSVLHSGL